MFYNPTNNEIMYSSASTNVKAKTFVIDHPTKRDSYLVHGCLEGPEAGVYYRGKARVVLNETVEVTLPDYVKDFAYEFTVSVTAIGEARPCGASLVNDGKFKIYGQPGLYHWMVHGQRNEIEVEPRKSSVTLRGDGPYTWY